MQEELSKAKVVASEDNPEDVVTMNSKVVLVDVDTHEEMNSRLVFPQDADVDMGFIYILAPIGTAILGYAKGDMVEWPVPSGIRRLQIKDILYQPEAAGDIHLQGQARGPHSPQAGLEPVIRRMLLDCQIIHPCG